MKTLLLFIAFLLIASVETTAKEQPFAPKANSYKTSSYKKYGKKKAKQAFACTKNRKINRKGLMK